MKKKKKKPVKFTNGIHHSTKTGMTYNYKSSWELAYMKFLDKSDDVKSYQYEQVIIMYVCKLKMYNLRKYLPDFLVEYLDGRKELIEIKPASKVKDYQVAEKAKIAEQWCREHNATFKFMTEVDLKKIGVL